MPADSTAAAPAEDLTAFDASAVRAVVFDLGNVLLDLDNTRYGHGWPRDIGAGVEGFAAWVETERPFYRYDTGRLATAEFLGLLGARVGLPPKRVLDYWNEILAPGIAARRYDTLSVLRERYPLYVLSNTNDAHIDWVREHVAAAGYPDFEARFFEGIVYSQRAGAVKPEAEIYAAAERMIDRPAGELLFIDDLAANVRAARARGWQAVQLAAGTPVETYTDRLP